MLRRQRSRIVRPLLAVVAGIGVAVLLVLVTFLLSFDWYPGGGYTGEQIQVGSPQSCLTNGTATNTSFDGAYFSVYRSNYGCSPGGSVLAGFVRDSAGSSGFFNLSDRLAAPQWFTPSGGAGVAWLQGGSVQVLVRVI